MRPPTLVEFAQQLGGAYLATEGALWRTLRLLLTRPGELTRRYLAGQRKHYVLPLRLYLTISVVVLLLIRLTLATGPDGAVKIDVNLDAQRGSNAFSLDIGGGRAGVQDGHFFCTGLPGWVCHRLQRRLDVDPKGLQREMQQWSQRVLGQIGGAMFVMLPAFALWLKLVYIDRRLRYT